MNNNDEWITDRLPTKEDALYMVLDDADALDGRPRTYECVRAAIAKATGKVQP